jgi:hypothetical protein
LDDLGVNIAHIAGCMDIVDKERLKRLIFRATRGKALTFFQDYEIKDNTGTIKHKSVYVVIF